MKQYNNISQYYNKSRLRGHSDKILKNMESFLSDLPVWIRTNTNMGRDAGLGDFWRTIINIRNREDKSWLLSPGTRMEVSRNKGSISRDDCSLSLKHHFNINKVRFGFGEIL